MNENEPKKEGNIYTIYCPGASGRSSYVPALVQIVRMSTTGRDRGQTNVICQRLHWFYNPQIPESFGFPRARIIRCYEREKYHPENKSQVKRTRHCLYFRSEEIEREEVEHVMNYKRYESEERFKEREVLRLWEKEQKGQQVFPDGLTDLFMRSLFPEYYRILRKEKLTSQQIL